MGDMARRGGRARLLGAAALAAGLAACGSAEGRLSRSGLYGAELRPPKPKPDFTLTATDGSRFPFRARTDGFLTLLFFGYTHCPDVCPVHMANLGAVIQKLPADVTNRIRVVFVTTDPARDTPARLRGWLDRFDPSFIGLTGSEAEVQAAQQAAGVLPAVREPSASDTSYTVGHAAYVIAYTADNLARAMYPFGTRQSDWAHDLPLLVAITGPPVEVSGPYVLAAPGADEAAAYFTLRNRGPDSLTVRGAAADAARGAAFHVQHRAGAMVHMGPAGRLVIPPHGSLRLEPGGLHLMLTGLTRSLAPGDTIHLRVSFEHEGDLRIAAPVRPYGS